MSLEHEILNKLKETKRINDALEVQETPFFSRLKTAAPASPVVGDMYLDDATDRLYVYVTGGWKYTALTA